MFEHGIFPHNYHPVRGMPGYPDVVIPTTAGKKQTWPPIQWPPDMDWPPDLSWPPLGEWPPRLCDLGSCWWDFANRFMRLVYRVGEYRLSLGLQSMIPWWDMRLCIMADPSIASTAIEWFRNMWNTIPGGSSDITFNLNSTSWYMGAVENVATSDGSQVSSERFYNAYMDKMYLFGRHIVEGDTGLNSYSGSTTVSWTRGKTLVYPGVMLEATYYWARNHSHYIRLRAFVGSTSTALVEIEIDAPTPLTWYQLSLEIDENEFVAKLGGAELRADIPPEWFTIDGIQENRIANSIYARRGNTSIDNAVIRLWIDAPIYHDSLADTWTLDDSDTETLFSYQTGDWTAETSDLQSAPTPFIVHGSGGGGRGTARQIEPFRLNSLGQCPTLRAWLGAAEIVVYGHIYG